MGYTRREADAEIYYGYDDYEFVRVFRPTAGEVPGVPSGIFLGIHGGLWHNPGDEALDMSGTGFITVADALRAQGHYVFVMEHIPTFSNFDWHWSPITAKLWPGPLLSAARCFAFILSNLTWDSEYGPLILSNSTASLSSVKTCILGTSSGADLAMLLACMPPGRFPIQGVVGVDTDNYNYSEFPRPKVVVNKIGQFDWSQYVFPENGELGAVYDGDINQGISINGGHGPWLTWTDTPLWVKKNMSPCWWVRAGYPGNRNISWYCHYNPGVTANGANLDQTDWSPGIPKTDAAAGKRFEEPHHKFQLYGCAKELTIAKIPNRCVIGTRLWTYENADWVDNGLVPGNDSAVDIFNYILERWAS